MRGIAEGILIILILTVTLATTGIQAARATSSSCPASSPASWGVGWWLQSDALAGSSWPKVLGLGGDVVAGYTGFPSNQGVLIVANLYQANAYLLQLDFQTNTQPVPAYAWIDEPSGAPNPGFWAYQMGTIHSWLKWYTLNIYNASSNWYYSYNTIGTNRQANGTAVVVSASTVASHDGIRQIPATHLSSNQIPLELESYDNSSTDWSGKTIHFGMTVFETSAWYWSAHGYVYADRVKSEPNWGTSGGLPDSGSCIPSWMHYTFNYNSGTPSSSDYYFGPSQSTSFSGNAGTKLY